MFLCAGFYFLRNKNLLLKTTPTRSSIYICFNLLVGHKIWWHAWTLIEMTGYQTLQKGLVVRQRGRWEHSYIFFWHFWHLFLCITKIILVLQGLWVWKWYSSNAFLMQFNLVNVFLSNVDFNILLLLHLLASSCDIGILGNFLCLYVWWFQVWISILKYIYR